MEFKSTLEGTPTRRVEIALPQERAEMLARTIDENIDWHSTEVEDELSALYGALLGLKS